MVCGTFVSVDDVVVVVVVVVVAALYIHRVGASLSFFLSLESYTQKFFLSLLFFLALNGSVGSRADSRTEK